MITLESSFEIYRIANLSSIKCSAMAANLTIESFNPTTAFFGINA